MHSGRGGPRAGAGNKKGTSHADNQGVTKAITFRLAEDEARLASILAGDYTHRQIYMAGVKAILGNR